VSPLPAPGSANSVQRVVFYLGGAYLLTDFQSPYTFTLPTTNWADGNYPLAVEADLRDGFITSQATIQVISITEFPPPRSIPGSLPLRPVRLLRILTIPW
jgi:hypothetical protein